MYRGNYHEICGPGRTPSGPVIIIAHRYEPGITLSSLQWTIVIKQYLLMKVTLPSLDRTITGIIRSLGLNVYFNSGEIMSSHLATAHNNLL